MKRNLRAGIQLNGGLSLNVLTDDEVNEIHLGTLELLDQTGIFVEDEKALDCFESGGARVDRKTKMVQIPPYLVEEVVRWRLEQHDWNYGFIVDGFPRNVGQTRFFLESYDVDAVIYIELADEVVRKRVLSRRLCSDCGLDYNLISHRPEIENRCDVCQGELVARPDDTPKALEERLKNYRDKTAPVLDLLRKKELVVSVSGNPPPEELHREICSQLNLGESSGPVA